MTAEFGLTIYLFGGLPFISSPLLTTIVADIDLCCWGVQQRPQHGQVACLRRKVERGVAAGCPGDPRIGVGVRLRQRLLCERKMFREGDFIGVSVTAAFR